MGGPIGGPAIGGPMGDMLGACQQFPIFANKSTKMETIPRIDVSLRNRFIVSLLTSWGRL
jgi:hypothetical protein